MTDLEMDYDIEHVKKLMTGFNNLLEQEDTPESNMVKGLMLATGMEASFWENAVDVAKKIAEKIMDVIKSIRNFFSGEGKEQIETEVKKAKDTIESIGKLDKTIPVPSGNNLLDTNKYFKDIETPSVPENISSKVESAISSVKNAVSQVTSVKTIADLIKAYTNIVNASEKASQDITSMINTVTSDAEKQANSLTTIDKPSETDTNEVKQAKKEEQKSKVDSANKSLDGTKELAKLRNKLLAPCTVISKTLKTVEGFKDQSKFKG